MASLSGALRRLLARKQLTVREIERITGRGSSTIYRWLSGESEPEFADVRAMLRELPARELRQPLLDAIVSDLPVTVTWLEDMGPRPGASRAARAPMDSLTEGAHASLDALRALSEAVSRQVGFVQQGRVSRQAAEETIELINRALHDLQVSKQALQEQIRRRRLAKRPEMPSGEPSQTPETGDEGGEST